MMQYFLAKGSALELNFCFLPEKYCIVTTSSPWVSEDVPPFKWMINLLKNHVKEPFKQENLRKLSNKKFQQLHVSNVL